METVGASLTQSAEWVHGLWNAHGEYTALGEGEHDTRIDWSLAAGYRVSQRWELAAQLAYGKQSLSTRGFASKSSGVGDAILRARWEALDAPMPMSDSPPWPSVAALFMLRVPTASTDRTSGVGGYGTTRTLGASASSQALGAWELALGADLERALSSTWRVSALGEAALRLPDDALGLERQLGPRVLGQIGLRYVPVVQFAFDLSTDLSWEGDVELDGQTKRGTTQRRWTLGAFASYRVPKTGLRAGALLRYAPPVSGVSVNAIAATALGVSLGYAR
jgi:hypothetical protein